MQGWSVSWNYTYPGSSDNGDERKAALIADPELLKAYGLLYNWEAASGRIYDPQINEENKPDQQQYRGVCPDGWHLPSD
jgi:uncharacterized protein (TIGR02145 family)